MSRERQGRIKVLERLLSDEGPDWSPLRREIFRETIKDLKELDEIKEKEEK